MGICTRSWKLDFALIGAIVLPILYIIRETVIFKILLLGFGAVYVFYQYKFRYWKQRGFPALTPWFPMGNIGGIFHYCPGDVLKHMYEEAAGHRFIGIWFLFRPALLIRDPDLIRQVLVKDFVVFHERGIYVNKKNDPLSEHVFALGGGKWRNIRVKLTPTFTTGKMKTMFPQFLKIATKFTEILEPYAKSSAVIDVKEFAARFSTDLTTLTAFGITTNALIDHDDPFRRMGRKLFEPSIFTIMRALMPFVVPNLSALIGVVQTPKELSDFFVKAINDIVEYREKNEIDQDDYMGLLLKLKNKGTLDKVDDVNMFKGEDEKEHTFTLKDIAAQAFVFFAAGFETAATIISWAIYELTVNPELQEKARKEIHTVLQKYDGILSYNALNEMTYLDKIIEETLRKYPPVPLILRKADKPYTIPGSELTIPVGTQVHISVQGLQRDPEFFPDPEKFDPDRFSTEAKSKRHHYAYLPFGEGPRNCFGMRYSMMQKKVGLIAMLNDYAFSLAPESPYPMKFDPDSFVFAPQGGMLLRITKC